MRPRQLDRIPSKLLSDHDTRPLLAWLYRRGWRMSLAELDAERRHRGIAPPRRRQP